MTTRVGVISDTHGLVRPEAIAALEGVDRIVHAGDIGGPEVLEILAAIAPVVAVRGNNDREDWAAGLSLTEVVEVEACHFYLLHEPDHLDLDPVAAEFQAVIHGHSHRPRCESKRGVLYLNPGSAGPRRFRLPVTLARLEVSGREIRHELVELVPPVGPAKSVG